MTDLYECECVVSNRMYRWSLFRRRYRDSVSTGYDSSDVGWAVVAVWMFSNIDRMQSLHLDWSHWLEKDEPYTKIYADRRELLNAVGLSRDSAFVRDGRKENSDTSRKMNQIDFKDLTNWVSLSFCPHIIVIDRNDWFLQFGLMSDKRTKKNILSHVTNDERISSMLWEKKRVLCPYRI